MTVAAPPRPFVPRLGTEDDPAHSDRVRPPRSDGGRLTLEQRLDGVWEGLRAAGVTECPVCRGAMVRDSHPGPGRCRDCGSRLS